MVAPEQGDPWAGVDCRSGGRLILVLARMMTIRETGRSVPVRNVRVAGIEMVSSSACHNSPDQVTGAFLDLGLNEVCVPPCPGDLNGDGKVSGADLSDVLGC